MIEHVMENISRVTNTDPVEVRILNMNDDDKKVLVPMIDELKKTSEYQKRLQDAEIFNKAHKKRI